MRLEQRLHRTTQNVGIMLQMLRPNEAFGSLYFGYPENAQPDELVSGAEWSMPYQITFAEGFLAISSSLFLGTQGEESIDPAQAQRIGQMIALSTLIIKTAEDAPVMLRDQAIFPNIVWKLGGLAYVASEELPVSSHPELQTMRTGEWFSQPDPGAAQMYQKYTPMRSSHVNILRRIYDHQLPTTQ